MSAMDIQKAPDVCIVEYKRLTDVMNRESSTIYIWRYFIRCGDGIGMGKTIEEATTDYLKTLEIRQQHDADTAKQWRKEVPKAELLKPRDEPSMSAGDRK